MGFPFKRDKRRKDSERKNEVGIRPGGQGHFLLFFWKRKPNTTVWLFETTRVDLSRWAGDREESVSIVQWVWD